MKYITDISKTLATVIALLTSIWFFGEPFAEDYINNKIDQRAVSPDLITKIMSSPFMIDQKRQEKREIIEDALHKTDSSKVKLSANLVLKTGMNKSAMADTLASIIKNYCKNSGFVDNEKCVDNAKTYGRGRMSPVTF